MTRPSQDDPTDAEIELTIAATRLILNTKNLLKDYEKLAAKHAEIPSPHMQSAMQNSIDDLTYAITAKDALIEISYNFSNELLKKIMNQ